MSADACIHALSLAAVSATDFTVPVAQPCNRSQVTSSGITPASGPASSRGTPPRLRLADAAGLITPAATKYRLATGKYWNAAGVLLPMRSCSDLTYSSIRSPSRSASSRCRWAIHDENRANVRSHRTDRPAEHPTGAEA